MSAFYPFRPTQGTEELWLASGELRLPLQTVSVSSSFGMRRRHPQHGNGARHCLGLAPGPGKTASRGGASSLMRNGVDLVAPPGTAVHAASDGKVVGAAPNAGYGNWIRIEHAHNSATVYGHLSEFALGISAGVEVHQGQVSATSAIPGGPPARISISRSSKTVGRSIL